MNKTAIWAIILIMSAAMLGIAAIQMYWINFSIRLDEKKFDERVYSALKRVEERVTKAEEETANWKNIGSGLSYNSYLRIEKDEGGIINMDTAGRVDIPAYGGYDPLAKENVLLGVQQYAQQASDATATRSNRPESLGYSYRSGIDQSWY